MAPEYFDSLPPEIQGIVREIEEHIDDEIRVRSWVPGDPTLKGSRERTCCISTYPPDKLSVTIVAPAADRIRKHTLVHELLHAHRRVVQGVPILQVPTRDRFREEIAQLVENDLEHLEIIPHEIRLCPDAIDYWQSHYDELTAGPIDTSDLNLQLNVLRHWLVASVAIPSWSGVAKLHDILATFAPYLNISRLRETLSATADKPMRLAILLSHMGEDICHFDTGRVIDGQVYFEALPEYSGGT